MSLTHINQHVTDALSRQLCSANTRTFVVSHKRSSFSERTNLEQPVIYLSR